MGAVWGVTFPGRTPDLLCRALGRALFETVWSKSVCFFELALGHCGGGIAALGPSGSNIHVLVHHLQSLLEMQTWGWSQ